MTIRELADELHISKVALNNRIEELELKGELIKQGNRYIIPGEVAEQLRESFRTRRKTEPAKDNNSDVIQILNEQLKAKDEQIASLMRQLEQLQSQNSDFMKVIQQNNYLLAGAIGNNDMSVNETDATIIEDESQAIPTEKQTETVKPGFFKRLFRL